MPERLQIRELEPREETPETGLDEIEIAAADHDEVAERIQDLLDRHDRALKPRLDRWELIENAYHLRPNSEHQGQKPDASRLVSEILRAQVKTGASILEEGLIGHDEPTIMVEVVDDQARDEETTDRVKMAEAVEEFWHAYSTTIMKMEELHSEIILMASKLGGCRVRLMWEVDPVEFSYRDRNGDVKTVTEERGRLKLTIIPKRLAISWPLTSSSLADCHIVGHRTHYERWEFHEFCASIGVSSEKVTEILGGKQGEGSGPHEDDDMLARLARAQDLDLSGGSPEGTVMLTELWGNMPLKIGEDRKFWQMFLHEPSKTILKVFPNRIHSERKVCYFELPYWREPESVHPTGIGDELLYPHAADSAVMNMHIDNFKVTGNHMKVVRADSMLATMDDTLAPGQVVVTEEPEEDLNVIALGDNFEEIYQLYEKIDYRAMRSSGLTPPSQGMADPVLKSGASPGSIAQLLAMAEKPLRKVDRNYRREWTELTMFGLELLQQYAPEGVFYETGLSRERAGMVERLRFIPPGGHLRKTFRLKPRVPSAAVNKELQKQNVMMLYNMTMSHVVQIIQMAQAAFGALDPAKVQRIQEEYVTFFNDLFMEMLKLHDIPGLTAKVPGFESTPSDQLVNLLVGKLQELQEQLGMSQGAQLGPGQPAPQMAGAQG